MKPGLIALVAGAAATLVLILNSVVMYGAGAQSRGAAAAQPETVEVVKEVPVEVVREVEVPVVVYRDTRSESCDAVVIYAEKISKATGRLSKLTGTHGKVLSDVHSAIVMKDVKEIVIQQRRQTELLRDSAGPIREIVENDEKLTEAIKACKEG